MFVTRRQIPAEIGQSLDPADLAGPWQRAVLVAAFAAVVAIRIPGILHGRFWAEDGYFLLDALRLPWHEAMVVPHTGYLDLFAGFTMMLATRLVRLEYAPLVSLCASLAVQVLPAVLLATGGIAWLRRPLHLAAAVGLMATLPLSEEVWLSPITAQYHLIVCVGIVLAVPPARMPVGLLHGAVLALAPLAGPGPSLVAPLFFLRALLDRSRPRALQAALISAGTIVQVAVVLGHPEPQRAIGIDVPLMLLVVWVKHILVPLFGRDLAIELAGGLPGALRASALPWIPILATAVAIVGLSAAMLRSARSELRWLFAGGLLAMTLSYVSSLGPKGDLLGVLYGARYYVAPQMLFALAVLGCAVTARDAWVRRSAQLVAMWIFVVGAREYAWVDPKMAHGPSWRAQVLDWRADPSRPIALWPSSFSIRLSEG